MEWLTLITQGAVGGAVTGLAAFAAIRVELAWLRRDVDDTRDAVKHAHRRIDDIHHKKGAV